MVKGIQLFRERFRKFEGAFVLIGGAACDEWFESQGLAFRATRDLDIVLIIEVLDQAFVTAMRTFIEEGGYEIRHRTEGPPILYRFAKPSHEEFPFMLELFTRRAGAFDLAPGQQIIPIQIEPDQHSLSAILLDDDYYQLIQSHSDEKSGVRVANATALIPLKARAWLDLSSRRGAGESVDSKSIDKHRADVFRLAATLPGEPGPEIPLSVKTDLSSFLQQFPADSPDWSPILASLKNTIPGTPRPNVLREAIQTYFGI